MESDIEIWVNKKEVLSKIKRLDFWELMYRLENLNGIRYFIFKIRLRFKKDVEFKKDIEKLIYKQNISKLSIADQNFFKDLNFLCKNLKEFIILPDEKKYDNENFICVTDLIEEFEYKIEK